MLKCPFCIGQNSQVLESRSVEDGQSIRRRRQCAKCGKRFTTYERIRKTLIWVVKRNGSRESFDKEKLRRGLLKAIEKRPVSIVKIDRLVDSVEREMLKKKKDEVSSQMIGRAVLRRLKKMDKVAWLRFASVYMEFNSMEDFEKAIRKEK